MLAVEAEVDNGALLQYEHPVEESERMRGRAVDGGHYCNALIHQSLHHAHDFVGCEGV